MFLLIILRKIKSLFCLIILILGKCFCCFRKKYEDQLPITITSQNIGIKNGEGFETWDSWEAPSSIMSQGKSFSPIEQHISQYRINQQRKLSDPPEEPNYFEDLAPKIKQKPQIVILARPEEEQQLSNRMSLSLAEPQLEGSELGEWNEEEGVWGEEDPEDVNAALREFRLAKKTERLKKKQLRDQTGVKVQKLAMKLS